MLTGFQVENGQQNPFPFFFPLQIYPNTSKLDTKEKLPSIGCHWDVEDSLAVALLSAFLCVLVLPSMFCG